MTQFPGPRPGPARGRLPVAMDWPDLVVDVTVALAAIATSTEKIRSGGLVTPPPRRRPWKFARETVKLDHLSAGKGQQEAIDHVAAYAAAGAIWWPEEVAPVHFGSEPGLWPMDKMRDHIAAGPPADKPAPPETASLRRFSESRFRG